VLSVALTSAPRAISRWARRRSFFHAAAISCSLSLCCSFASGLAGSLFGWELGWLVDVGLAGAGVDAACSDGLDVAASSPLQAAVARTITVKIANERMSLIVLPMMPGLTAPMRDRSSLSAVTNPSEQDHPVRLVAADDPLAAAATAAVQAGDLDALERLLSEGPWLATARIGDWDCNQTLLHAATDWPGHFPNGPAVVQRLVAEGADVNAHSRFSSHTETPLHWAASSDDMAVLDALLDAGADIEATGAVLGGGTPLADASGFGNWAAARRLVERGAQTRLSDAAALGLLDRVEAVFADGSAPSPEVITQAFWNACHGGQLRTAEYLLERGAAINWIGWDDKTPLDLVEETAQPELAAWLRDRGAKHAAELG